MNEFAPRIIIIISKQLFTAPPPVFVDLGTTRRHTTQFNRLHPDNQLLIVKAQNHSNAKAPRYEGSPKVYG